MSEFKLDVLVLEKYLEQHIDGFKGPVTADKFSGGQSNPTYLLTSQDNQYVLRRKPPGILLKSAHAVDREYRVMSALSTTPVPVPRMFHICEDDSVIGSMFIIMEYMDGRILWNAALPEQSKKDRTEIYNNMNQVLADLHSVNIAAVDLSSYGKPGNYFERQLSRWTRQYRASETETIPEMNALISWLEVNKPAGDGQVCLVHGDYRLDNLMLAKESNDIIAVLDWELSTLGHPYADLAYQCMQLRIPSDAAIPGLGNIDRAELGIPSEEEYVAQYCARRNIKSIPNWEFYVAFSFFRLSAILQGIQKRRLDGNASSEQAKAYGGLAKPLAQLGAEFIGGE